MKKVVIASVVLGILGAATQAFAAPAALHSNASPPAPRNPSAATGRSGNASIAVRALVDKDDMTVVDITTGALDSTAAAPGNITKVQLKAFRGDGDTAAWTKNYSGLSGGRLQYTFDDLHRGQPVQTQANVKSIDGKRTDVVTVTGNVKRRPDLSVDRVDAPAKVPPGTYINVAATISERNGDVAATGNCKLFVDDVQVDEARGIFVDAGRATSCAFTTKLDAAGVHTLRVLVDGVVPGDWDTANNAASTTTEVASPAAPFYWDANAYSYSYAYSYSNEGSYRYSDGSWFNNYDYEYEWSETSRYQQSGVSGYSPTRLRFPLSRFEGSQKLDGVAIDDLAFDDVQAQWSWGDADYGRESVQLGGGDGSSFLYLHGWSYYGNENTYAQYYRFAGDYVYYSRGYESYWYGYVGGSTYGYTYSYNYSGAVSYFPGAWVDGTSYAITLRAVGADGAAIEAYPSITTELFAYQYDNPRTCNEYSWSWGTEKYCHEDHQSYSGRQGYASGVTNP